MLAASGVAAQTAPYAAVAARLIPAKAGKLPPHASEPGPVFLTCQPLELTDPVLCRLRRLGRLYGHRPAEFPRRGTAQLISRDRGAVMRLGIIGAGHIGGNIAHRAAQAGYDVMVSFARNRANLAVLAAEIGGTAGERIDSHLARLPGLGNLAR